MVTSEHIGVGLWLEENLSFRLILENIGAVKSLDKCLFITFS